MSRRGYSSFAAAVSVVGVLMGMAVPASASIQVVAFVCDESGNVTIFVGDTTPALSTTRKITIDGNERVLDGAPNLGPQETDVDGFRVANGATFQTASQNVQSWRTTICPAGTLTSGVHTIDLVRPTQFSDPSRLFPWTTEINCDVNLDTDNDGVPDEDDDFPFDPTEDTDTDGDGVGDNAELDDDNDGLTDLEEAFLGTDPLLADTDDDGVDDGDDPRPLDGGISQGGSLVLFAEHGEEWLGIPAVFA